jgi:hypothetical protein
MPNWKREEYSVKCNPLANPLRRLRRGEAVDVKGESEALNISFEELQRGR